MLIVLEKDANRLVTKQGIKQHSYPSTKPNHNF